MRVQACGTTRNKLVLCCDSQLVRTVGPILEHYSCVGNKKGLVVLASHCKRAIVCSEYYSERYFRGDLPRLFSFSSNKQLLSDMAPPLINASYALIEAIVLSAW